MQDNARVNEAKIRRLIRERLNRRGIRVNSVAWIDRETGREFAVIVVPREFTDARDVALEFITNPSFPFRVTRERAGRQDDFIYLAY